MVGEPLFGFVPEQSARSVKSAIFYLSRAPTPWSFAVMKSRELGMEITNHGLHGLHGPTDGVEGAVMTPTVPVFVTRDESAGVWLLEVQCPFCGDRHQHGGGPLSLDTPDLGHRISHCARPDRADYELVLGPTDMVRPQVRRRRQRSRLAS